MYKLELFDKQDKTIACITTGADLEYVREDLKKIIRLTSGAKGLAPHKYVLTVCNTDQSISWESSRITKRLETFIEDTFYGACTYNQFVSFTEGIFTAERDKLTKHLSELYNLSVIDAISRLQSAVVKEQEAYLDTVREEGIEKAINSAFTISYYDDAVQFIDSLCEELRTCYLLRDFSPEGVQIYTEEYVPLEAIDKLIEDGGILGKMFEVATNDDLVNYDDQSYVLYCILKDYSNNKNASK